MKQKIILAVIVLCVLLTGCKTENYTIIKDTDAVCTISVDCKTVLQHMNDLESHLKDYIPKDGIILKETKVAVHKGDSVYDVLERTLKEHKILMEASFTGKLAYIEGIDNLYEFSCGELSGWMYAVNGNYPNVGCSSFEVKDGDKIEWRYTCDIGKDLGQEYMTKQQ